MTTYEFQSIPNFDGDVTIISTDADTLEEAKEELFGDGILNRHVNWTLVDMYPCEEGQLIYLGQSPN